MIDLGLDAVCVGWRLAGTSVFFSNVCRSSPSLHLWVSMLERFSIVRKSTSWVHFLVVN